MPQSPDFKQLLELGANFTELGRAQARQIVGDLVAQGQVAQDKASGAVDELIEMSRRRRENLRGFIAAEIQRQVGALGIATREDLERLERKIDAAAKAPAKKAPVKKAPVRKAVAKEAPATTVPAPTAAAAVASPADRA